MVFLLFLACLTNRINFPIILNATFVNFLHEPFPSISLRLLLMMEINNFKIFLTFWLKEKQIFLLVPMDYDICQLLIEKFSNFKSLSLSIALALKFENLSIWSGKIS